MLMMPACYPTPPPLPTTLLQSQQLLTDALLAPFSLSQKTGGRKMEEERALSLVGFVPIYTDERCVCVCVRVCSIVCV
jgi:hypothetical protein